MAVDVIFPEGMVIEQDIRSVNPHIIVVQIRTEFMTQILVQQFKNITSKGKMRVGRRHCYSSRILKAHQFILYQAVRWQR